MSREPKACLRIHIETRRIVRYSSRRTASLRNRGISYQAVSDCCNGKIAHVEKFVFVDDGINKKEIERRCVNAINTRLKRCSLQKGFLSGEENPNAIPIDMIEIETKTRVKEFATMADATHDLKIPTSKISAILHGSVGILNGCILVQKGATDYEIERKITACKEVMSHYTVSEENR